MPKLDLTYYSGDDHYSDGNVEDRILSYIDQTPDGDFSRFFKEDQDLPIFYHLSDIRKALLSWYDFNPAKSVLEIGAGMGALTGLLCDRCAHVTSIEFSKRRAQAIVDRYREKDNLDVIVGDFFEIELSRKFDYITIIGVLEHVSVFNDSPSVQTDFLKKVRSLLAPGGKVLLAIENKFGLKYWCGEVDDHSGIPFGTINDFAFGGKARTFSKKQLEELLNQSGLPTQKFYYPLPDYKFPRVIYSENYLPTVNIHASMHPIYYSNYYPYQAIVASEKKLYGPIIQNGVFEFFANSFLVECAQEDDCLLNEVDFAAITVERNPKYQTCIKLKGDMFEKSAVYPCGQAHLAKLYKNIEHLSARGMKTVNQCWVNDAIQMPYVHSDTLEDRFLKYIAKGDQVAAIAILDDFLELIRRSSEIVSPEKNHVPQMGISVPMQDVNYGDIAEIAYCDMILSNCFYSEKEKEGYCLYDQEWAFPCLPINYVMYQAISVLYHSYPEIEQVLPLDLVQNRYGIAETWNIYQSVQGRLFADVQNGPVCAFIGAIRALPPDKIRGNIELLKDGTVRLSSLQERVDQAAQIIEEKDRQIVGRDTVISEKDEQIAGRDEVIREKDGQIAGRNKVIEEKNRQIAGRDEIIREKDGQIAGRDMVIEEKDRQIAGRDEVIREKDGQIAGRDKVIKEKDRQIAGRDEAILEKDRQIVSRELVIGEKDSCIAELNKMCKEQQEQIQSQQDIVDSYLGKNMADRLHIAWSCLRGKRP